MKSEDKIISIKSKLMNNIAKYKIKNELTQREIAVKCSIGQSRVSDLLNAKFERFTIDQLIKLNYRLGIELDLLSLSEK